MKETIRELNKLMTDLDKDLMMPCKQNAKYLPQTSQNELLLCINEFIPQEIVNKVKNGNPFFGLSADDVTDISSLEPQRRIQDPMKYL